MPNSVLIEQFGKMVVTCDIEFDQNPFGTYFAGQLVSGAVTLKSDKAKDVKAVVLEVSGYASTNWTEKSISKKNTYNGYEDYMSTLTYLLGSEESTVAKSTIPAGTHQYTFACQLPYNCPTSFEGSYGHIRFVAKVVLIRPWKYNQTYTRGMTVLRTVDLNNDSPQLKMPAHTSNYRTFGCGPCTTEPLKMELSIPQSGFVPGQNIPVSVLVINNTNIAVASLEFSLVMLVRYYSSSPPQYSHVERLAISIAKGESVLRNCTRSISQDLHVPSTPPSCLNACKLIQIVYQIEVEAKMKGMHPSQMISIPVTIGNVPIWNSVISQQPSNNYRRALLEEVTNSQEATVDENVQKPVSNLFVRSSPNALYPDLPPPQYEESGHTVRSDINEGELHAFGRNDFTPLYPVYCLPKINDEIINGEPENEGYVNESYIE